MTLERLALIEAAHGRDCLWCRTITPENGGEPCSLGQMIEAYREQSAQVQRVRELADEWERREFDPWYWSEPADEVRAIVGSETVPHQHGSDEDARMCGCDR